MRPIHFVTLSAALGLPACADTKGARGASDRDAAPDGGHPEASRPHGDGGCTAQCAGRCFGAACLTTLAEAPRPRRLVLDGIVMDASVPLIGIAVDGSALYATTASGVVEAPLGGGPFTPLATIAGQRDATRPVLDEQSVYFADPELGTVYRVARDGGDVTPLAAGLGGVEALALGVGALRRRGIRGREGPRCRRRAGDARHGGGTSSGPRPPRATPRIARAESSA